MRIRRTIPAADDLEGIHEYLKEHHPHLAQSTVTEIHKAIRSLKKFPHPGAPVCSRRKTALAPALQ